MGQIEISVLMIVHNGEFHIKETIESVLNQSFDNFDFIIVDNNSSDKTKEIIKSYQDPRIVLIENKHSFVDSVNRGLAFAKGKYIAFMNYGNIMHIDRLRIQYAIMEESPEITVCSSTMKVFGFNTTIIEKKADFGLIEYPLLKLMRQDFIWNSTAMIRIDYLRKKNIKYENYSYASDYKFYVEVAKVGGIFYTESQPLVYYRLMEQTSPQYKQEKKTASVRIQNEIIQYFVCNMETKYPELNSLLIQLRGLKEKGLMTDQNIITFYQDFFMKNQNIIKNII
jgi:glycosyltransferase involved in cell wall biosynthesis